MAQSPKKVVIKKTVVASPTVKPKLGTDAVKIVPGAVLVPGTVTPPLALQFSVVGNLFHAARPGRPVVRPDDLLALRLQLVNLSIKAGTPPRLKRSSASGAAYLILHHPPQSIAEEVFWEAKAAGVGNADVPPKAAGQPDPPSPPADSNVDPPPIRARAAGESRVVFEWPVGFECDYTMAGVLMAVQSLKMNVPMGARPRPPARAWSMWPRLLAQKLVVKRGAGANAVLEAPAAAVGTRALSLNSFSLRQTQIALRGGVAAEATLMRRLTDISPGLQLGVVDIGSISTVRIDPKPAPPGATETALELPWRLILSPHAGEQWRHAAQAVTSPTTLRTELWHTRLLGSGSATQPPLEPPHADASRTVRAVWATTGPNGKLMQQDFPQGFTELPLPGEGDPPLFLPTLNDYDRYQLAHLSANFSTDYVPQPMDTNLLMLSALGGWLDCRGDWEPPGLDVESWVHRAAMGRDHYVRVVYRGVLFPFGHRAVLIKVSERKFHGSLPGNPAYLRQRMFMVVREREKRYDDAGSLQPFGAGDQTVKNEFPFTHVRMLTTVTPDLSEPKKTEVKTNLGQLLFWPATGSGNTPTPFRFRMAATDLDGRNIEFDLPLIFMSNSLASPRKRSGKKLLPMYGAADAQPGLADATSNAQMALQGWNAKQPVADMKRQRIAMALSAKAGDTAIEAISMHFGAHVPAQADPSQAAFRAYSQKLTRPMFFPRVLRAQVRIAAMAQLSGSDKLNQVQWNSTYLKSGFNPAVYKGEVFLEVPSSPDMARLDFSKQGDRSGGFVMPNLSPTALSRALGPTAGKVADVLAGKVKPTEFFPASGADLPLPLLFGCIPLSAVITQVDDLLGNLDKAPKFASEAGSKVESFFNDLMRLYQFISALAEQPANLAQAALEVVRGTLEDLKQQALAFGAAQANELKAKVDAVLAPLNALRTQLTNLAAKSFDVANPLAGINLGDASLRQALTNLANTVSGMPQIPAGFRQALNAAVVQLTTVLDALALIAGLYTHGKALFDALKALLANDAPGQSIGELITKPGELAPKIGLVADRLDAVYDDVTAFPLLEGPPRKTILDIIDVVRTALGTVEDLLELLENLLGEELVLRFDWKPEIKSWGFTPSAPLFVVHDKHAFIIAVEARVKKSGGPPKIQVLCGLHHFDLVLIAPASFIELNFEKIEFSVDSAAKMNVDVLLNDIKFVGPLSFVETLRDLIPLDGFSDPPYLDITAQGIDAGFDISLPSISCGILNLSNVSLGAGFTVPFIGQPLSVRFNFCTREQPFHLTVYMFGGGGFFGITLDPKGIQIMEAAFEFGAAISIDLGVASGGVSVMAGIYFRMEGEACSLTGYFRLEGHVDVLGLITASLELYLELRYEFETGKCVGRASLTIEIEVFIFSGSVTVSCERKFAGSNGDPTFRQLMGLSSNASLPLADELASIDNNTAYAWRDYCEAFA